MATTNLGRVQGAGFFYTTASSGTSIALSTITPTSIKPLVGDCIIFPNGDVRKITAISASAATCGAVLTSLKGATGATGPEGPQGPRGPKGAAGKIYKHHIVCTDTNSPTKILIEFPSSNNLKVESLADLKTLLGATFECSCTGFSPVIGEKPLVICNEKGFLPLDVWVNVVNPTPDVTWANITTINDTVTTA